MIFELIDFRNNTFKKGDSEMIKFGKRIRHIIEIEATMNGGFIVRVGCGTFSFENNDSLLNSLKEYLENPNTIEDAYNKAGGPAVHMSDRPVEAVSRSEDRAQTTSERTAEGMGMPSRVFPPQNRPS